MKRLFKQGSTRVGFLACLMLGLLALACLSLPPFLKKAEAGCNPPPGKEWGVTMTGPNTVCRACDATFVSEITGDNTTCAPFSYEWKAEYGDPSTGTGSTFTTKWNAIGHYKVTLVVKDNGLPDSCGCSVTNVMPVAVVTVHDLQYTNQCTPAWTNLPNNSGPNPPPFVYVGTNVGIRALHACGVCDPGTNHWPATCDGVARPQWTVSKPANSAVEAPGAGTVQWVLNPDQPGKYEITAECGESMVTGRLTALELDTLTVHEPVTAHAKSKADSTDGDPPRSETNTLFICQTQDPADGSEASINFDLTWKPEDVDGCIFKWKIDPPSWGQSSGDFASPVVTSRWDAVEEREYDVWAWYDQCDSVAEPSNCPHRQVYLTVVDLDTFTLSSVSNCPRSVVDTTRTNATPTGTTAMLSLLQIGNRESNLDAVQMTLDLTWLPSTVNSNWFRWNTVSTNGAESGWATNVWSYEIRPFVNTWHDKNDAVARSYDVWSWFDCDNHGGDASHDASINEPERKLQAQIIFFEDIAVKSDPPPASGAQLKLSPGAKFTASVVKEPDPARQVVWEVTDVVSDDDANKLEVQPMSLTTSGDYAGTLFGGGGRFTLRVKDAELDCVTESVVVYVGCSCSECAVGVCEETSQAGFRYNLGDSCLWLLTTNSPMPKDLLWPRHRIKDVDGDEDGVELSYNWPDDKMDVALSNQIMKSLSNPFVDVLVSESPTNWTLTIAPKNGGDPFIRTFANTSGGGPNIEYTVTETRGSYTNIEWFARGIEGGSNFWRRTSGAGAKVETELSSFDGVYTNELSIVQDGAGARSYVAARKRFAFPWGAELVEQTIDPDGAALRTTWTYYTNSADTLRYGRVMTVTEPDGSWTRYDYTQYGLHSIVVSGFKDTASNADPSEAKATYYTYDLGAALSPYSPRSVTETTLGVTNSKTLYAYSLNDQNERVETVERCLYGDAAAGSTNNLRTVTTFYSAALSNAAMGRVKSVVQTDGRQDGYVYERGTYVTNADPALCSFIAGAGTDLRTTVTHGTTNSPAGIAGTTTRNVTVSDSRDRTLLADTWVYMGQNDYQRVDWTVETRDVEGRVIRTDRSDGTYATATWGCCNKESEQDENGIQYDNEYDALRRLSLRVKLGATTNDAFVATAYSYDASGRQLGQVVSASTGGLSQTTTNAYDLAGRLVWSRDPSGLETAYIHDGLTETTIRAGLTNVTVRYLDGQPKYTADNGVVKSFHDYGVNADGTQWSQVYTGPLGTNSPAWQKTTTDLLGRTIRDERPGFGGTVLTNSSYYNTLGQLVRSTQPSTPDTLNEYDSLGTQFRSGLDVNTNGVLDLAGPDRVSESAVWFEQGASNIWQVRASILYAGDNSSVPTTNNVQRTRLTGLGSSSALGALRSELTSLDLLGNTTTSRTYINRAAKTVTQVVTAPDSTNNGSQITINGLLVSSTSKTGIQTVYSSDALGRQVAALQGSGTTHQIGAFTHYNSLGQVDWTMDVASNKTSYVFDSAGRRTQVTDALSNSTFTAYDAHNRDIATWGATYPITCDFDDFGRKIAIYTYRGTNEISSYSHIVNQKSQMDRTAWLYDQATGLLTNKIYNDGRGPAYTYTPDGKLATRTWARGVTTDYSYDSLGQLTNINYNDSTPAVSFSYDRLGRQTTITDAQGTRVFTYNDALQLAAETNVTGQLIRTYDSLGRSSGFLMGSDLGSAPYSVSNSFDSLGKFISLSAVVGGISNSWNYSFVSASELLSGWTAVGSGVTVTRNYEPNRNLLTGIINGAGSTLISGFDYVNDALGRRTLRIDEGSAVATNVFSYNSRSELTTALMGTNSFAWELDPIGNRVSATGNSVTHNYTANALNQYTQITNGGLRTLNYDLDGNLTNDGALAYSWDSENRMVGASNANTDAHFAYDYMSRRYRKIVNGVTNNFVYDGWNLVTEISSGGTQSITNRYVWGLDLSGTLQGAGGIGGLLSVTRNGVTYFPCYDANGNITDYVDINGVVVAHREYDAYGNTLVASGSIVDAFSFWFSSKYLDRETGLYYYGHRFYSTELSRWISRDPVGEEGGLSLYGFVGNSPTFITDSLGLMWSDPPALPPKDDSKCTSCCICISEPWRCVIEVKWTGEDAWAKRYSRPRLSDVAEEAQFGTAALVVLKHARGKSVSGCHLHQGVEQRKVGDPATPGGSNPNDYGSGVRLPSYPFYGATWLFDSPAGWFMPARVGTYSEPSGKWFEAHVYVEEAPSVETWWGFAGTIRWNRSTLKPSWKYERWSYVHRGYFTP